MESDRCLSLLASFSLASKSLPKRVLMSMPPSSSVQPKTRNHSSEIVRCMISCSCLRPQGLSPRRESYKAINASHPQGIQLRISQRRIAPSEESVTDLFQHSQHL